MKILDIKQNLPVEQRGQAADAIASEAYWRVRDPVYGSVGVISLLQQQIYAVQSELAETQAQIALHSAQQQQHRQQNQVQLENHPYGLDDSQQFGLDQGPSGPQNPPNFP
ncbi:uncharacterized protein A4U43_C05F1970 [Asparagus officinalis]|uniref:LOB domain-containing protein n=1 Tax=Asparagus officinalis TaxID=4686 RepID=A0A5P1EU64_ASPOF|nr:uncharacterized protein A4U43_C05F1970 [Asparagus officinalis]